MAVSAAAPGEVSPARAFRDGALWMGVGVYALAYFVMGWVRYAGHRNFVDLGIFTQTAASAFRCFCNPIEGSHWAFHFTPLLYLVHVFMHLWHSALTLVALQAVAGALTAPPVYGIVRRYADRKTALLAALVVLLYPPLGGVVFNDFHENGFAPAAVAWLLWAFDGGFVLWTIVFAALTLAVKEDQALFVAIAGTIGAYAYRREPARMRLAAGVALAGLAVFVLYFAVIQPHAAANPQWAPVRFYAWMPADWRALPAGLLARAGFLLLAFVPLLFIPFRSWAIVSAVVPFLEVLGSRMSTTYTMGSHYAGAWAGWVFFAFALGLVNIWRGDPRRAQKMLYGCIALCVIEFAVANPLHPGYFLRAPAARDARLDEFLKTLPPNLNVATQEEAYTHLAATNPNVTLLPEQSQSSVRACYLLTDEDFPESVRLSESAWLVRALEQNKTYVVIRHDDGIKLYRSTLCPQSIRATPLPR